MLISKVLQRSGTQKRRLRSRKERGPVSCAWARARLAQPAPSRGAVLTDFSLPGCVTSHLVKPGRQISKQLSGSFF